MDNIDRELIKMLYDEVLLSTEDERYVLEKLQREHSENIFLKTLLTLI